MMHFIDGFWAFLFRPVGRVIHNITGVSTAKIGRWFIFLGWSLVLLANAIERDYFWLTIDIVLSLFFVPAMTLLLRWVESYDGTGDTIPLAYAQLCKIRETWGTWVLILTILFTSIYVSLWMMLCGLHIATMCWPKRKNIVKRWLENRERTPVLVPAHVPA